MTGDILHRKLIANHFQHDLFSKKVVHVHKFIEVWGIMLIVMV
jgi:hypothetical protein